MRSPKGLGPRGRALFQSIVQALPDDDGNGGGWDFDEREVAVLTLAARQADDVAKLERVVATLGAMVVGSTGQPVLNPAISEARQGRLAINRLLGELSLPDEDEEPRTAAGRRGKHAAAVRWDLDHERRTRRGAA